MAEAINEGIEIENDLRFRAADGRKSRSANRKNQGAMRSAPSEQGDYDFDRVKKEPLTSKQVGSLITRVGMDEIGVKVFKLIQELLPKGDKSKNVKSMKGLR